jgi:hypothetical protein
MSDRLRKPKSQASTQNVCTYSLPNGVCEMHERYLMGVPKCIPCRYCAKYATLVGQQGGDTLPTQLPGDIV